MRASTAHTDSPLIIGFLHLGGSGSAIRRHGEQLASVLDQRPGVEIVQTSADPNIGGVAGMREIGQAARALGRADVAVIPYSPHRLWAGGQERMLQLAATALLLHPVVVLLHDVYPATPWRSPDWRALAVLAGLGRELVFQEDHERTTLDTLPGALRATRIAHPIIPTVLPPRDASRAALGVPEDALVAGMIGWIHQRKNPEAAVRALAHLDERVQMWFVGGSAGGDESRLDRLRALAAELGVADRLVLTGYVSESELGCRLAALDLGLVPYRTMSASASLATLIAADVPVVASDLPVTRELVELAPGSIITCDCDDPVEFAEAIRSMTTRPLARQPFERVHAARSLVRAASELERVARQAAQR